MEAVRRVELWMTRNGREKLRDNFQVTGDACHKHVARMEKKNITRFLFRYAPVPPCYDRPIVVRLSV